MSTKKKKGELRKKVCNLDGEFILTDSCFWEEDAPKDYNPLDPTRSPHEVECVDTKTGTIARVPSGSIIKIVKLNNV